MLGVDLFRRYIKGSGLRENMRRGPVYRGDMLRGGVWGYMRWVWICRGGRGIYCERYYFMTLSVIKCVT